MTKNKHRKYKFIIPILLLIPIIYIMSVYNQVKAYDTVLAHNIWVNHFDIGGMTPEEASKYLSQNLISTLDSKTITLTTENNTSTVGITYKELGVTYNLDEILSEAIKIGHEGNLFERYKSLKNPSVEPLHFTLTPNIDSSNLKERVESYLDPFYKAPVNAEIKKHPRSFEITPEVPGYKADLDFAVTQIQELIAQSEEGTIYLPLITLEPEYTSDILQDYKTPLASFYTTFTADSPDRNTNITLAAQKINTTLQPGEKFMFSKQLEPITIDAGYKNAKVITGGEFVDGIGGGICQVSSTLYNAVIMTDLDIYMRRNHSLPVSYTPLGRDATYATNSVDFQFINNSGYPLYVESYIEDNKVFVNLYGHKDFKPDYTAQFESELIETLEAPEPLYKDDPTLPPGKEIIKSHAKEGHKIVLYKLYYKNGELIKKEKINTSTYKPQRAVILRGPQPQSSEASSIAADSKPQ
ncbi:VanW family protein [Zhenhengia yiwuensis]|uniref:VanW family protein n=1 Tax=Zhenhengia yiwuensis TaxID=2763666 RepID=UPI002A75C753|nr:VanW family protein [Zhenhengia yiwuensis]MDY3368786.1 VanW family protein [Zhenhengia yiwuensis]